MWVRGVFRLALLDDQDVAVGVAQQERRDGAEQRVLDGGQAAGTAEDQVGLDDVEHLVLQGLADATGANHNVDGGDGGVGLGLLDLGGDGIGEGVLKPLDQVGDISNANVSPWTRSAG